MARFLYQRGKGAKRRVVHLCGYDDYTGLPSMRPFCGQTHGLTFDTTSNVPFGRPTCKRCIAALSKAMAS